MENTSRPVPGSHHTDPPQDPAARPPRAGRPPDAPADPSDKPTTRPTRAGRPPGTPADPSDKPTTRPTRAGHPPDAPADHAGRRHRAGTRRHRAGIVPPVALGLAEPVPGQPGSRPGLRRARVSPGLLDPAVADPTDDEELAGARDEADETRRRAVRRHRLTLAGLALTAVLSAIMLVVTLINWAPAATREMTTGERDRLAAMRVTNQRDLRAGLRLTVGDGTARIDLLGWVDWARQLVYLDVTGPGAGQLRGLAQATPTVLVLRPDPAAMPSPAMPPLVPPVDGWRLPADRRLDPVLDLVFALASDRPDPVDGLTGRWVGRDRINGETVDILSGTALPLGTDPDGTPPPGTDGTPPPGTGPEGARAPGTARPLGDGATRYWLAPDGRLHRLEARLPEVGPVHVQLNRADRPTLRPVDALGGRAGLPRALTPVERDRWRRLPARLRAAGGATITVTVPAAAGTNLRGAGWLSWTSATAYVGVTDLDADRRILLWRDRSGLARIEQSAAGGRTEPPPLPTPRTGWRTGPHRTEALAPLLDAAMRIARGSGPAGSVRRIRGDNLAGRVVDVLEVETARGRVRYWVERTGLLRRLELPTRGGVWAQLDLTPGRVPRLTVPAGRR